MPNLPFRVAFWALCISFAMLVMLSVINPGTMRSDVYAKKTEPVTAPDWQRIEKTPTPIKVVEAEPTLAPQYASGELTVAKLEPEPEPTLAPSPDPLMVASAYGDFRRDIGGLYPIVEEQKNVTVPEPHDPETITSADLATLVSTGVVAAPTIADYHQEEPTSVLLEKMASIQSDLASIKAFTVLSPVISPLSMEKELSFSVSASERKGRWTFEFEETELRDALQALGEQIGWTVVVKENVQGLVDTAFVDADPEQAFAALVKSNRCTVSRRGDYILIDQR